MGKKQKQGSKPGAKERKPTPLFNQFDKGKGKKMQQIKLDRAIKNASEFLPKGNTSGNKKDQNGNPANNPSAVTSAANRKTPKKKAKLPAAKVPMFNGVNTLPQRIKDEVDNNKMDVKMKIEPEDMNVVNKLPQKKIKEEVGSNKTDVKIKIEPKDITKDTSPSPGKKARSKNKKKKQNAAQQKPPVIAIRRNTSLPDPKFDAEWKKVQPKLLERMRKSNVSDKKKKKLIRFHRTKISKKLRTARVTDSLRKGELTDESAAYLQEMAKVFEKFQANKNPNKATISKMAHHLKMEKLAVESGLVKEEDKKGHIILRLINKN